MGRHKELQDARYLTVRIDGWTDEKLREVADDERCKVNKVVRDALMGYLDYGDRLLEAK